MREIEVKVKTINTSDEKEVQLISSDMVSSPIVQRLEQIDHLNAPKEQTFGQTIENDNLETIQVHNLTNIKREEDLRTERKINNAQLVNKDHYIASHTIQSDLFMPGTGKASQGTSINSKFETTLKKDPNEGRSEIDILMKDSEDYFNSVINQVNQDINPQKSFHSRIKGDFKKTGKIQKNKPKKTKNKMISSLNPKFVQIPNSLSKFS